MAQKKYVTLKEVAELAETSTATVSYVLNGGTGRYVSDELRKRVLDAAKELNYVKSALASGLKGKQRGVIAVTVPQFANIFFSRLVLAVEQVAMEQNYLVTVSNTFDDPERENKVVDSLIQQRVDGIILIPNEHSSCNYENLRRIGIPTIVAERPVLDGDYDFVSIDNFEAGYQATRYLLERGHRSIAFLAWDTKAVNLQQREKGYQAALEEAGVPLKPEYILHDTSSPEGGARMSEKISGMKEVTALIYAFHVQAQGGLPVLRQAGVMIPDELSVVVIGNPEWINIHTPSLTHVVLPSDEVGKNAAKILLDRINDSGNYSSACQIQLAGSLVEGNSVKTI